MLVAPNLLGYGYIGTDSGRATMYNRDTYIKSYIYKPNNIKLKLKLKTKQKKDKCNVNQQWFKFIFIF